MRKYKILMVYYLLAFLAWPLITGWAYASRPFKGFIQESVLENTRYLGKSIVYMLPLAILWPMGVPIVFCLTGFAQNGWEFTTEMSK